MSIFPTKILLATDGSEDAELALEAAVDLTNNTSSELHVITVGGEYHPAIETSAQPELLEETLRELERGAKEILKGQVNKIEEAGGKVTQHHLRMGNPAKVIVGQADEMDTGLIVVGSRGLGGIRRALMGSVSDSVARHAHCPVLVVREKKR